MVAPEVGREEEKQMPTAIIARQVGKVRASAMALGFLFLSLLV